MTDEQKARGAAIAENITAHFQRNVSELFPTSGVKANMPGWQSLIQAIGLAVAEAIEK